MKEHWTRSVLPLGGVLLCLSACNKSDDKSAGDPSSPKSSASGASGDEKRPPTEEERIREFLESFMTHYSQKDAEDLAPNVVLVVFQKQKEGDRFDLVSWDKGVEGELADPFRKGIGERTELVQGAKIEWRLRSVQSMRKAADRILIRGIWDWDSSKGVSGKDGHFTHCILRRENRLLVIMRLELGWKVPTLRPLDGIPWEYFGGKLDVRKKGRPFTLSPDDWLERGFGD